MVTITCGRSEAIFDGTKNLPEDIAGSVVVLGPFDCVGFTYDTIRVYDREADDSRTIGYFKDGLWWLEGDPWPFSDIDVHPPVTA